MADFEELKLTVNLTDNASAGLASLRTQITQLAQSAGQVQTAFSGVASSIQSVGTAANQTTPHVRTVDQALKGIGKSAEETGRGIAQMLLSMKGGVGAFPQLALGLREAQTGLVGVNEGLAAVGVTSRLAIVGLASVTVGVVAVGAAIVAYGVSVFKFSREMYTLGQAARSLGVTFGSLKSLTEQNQAFGVSAENTIAQLGRMQGALADLSVSGSQLRQQMIGMGVPPQRIDEITRETDAIKRQNMIRADTIKITDDLQRRMGKEAAREWANRYASMWGADPTAQDRPALKSPSAAELKQQQDIADQSRKIAEHWATIYEAISKIKDEFQAWGLPTLLSLMEKMANVAERISKSIDQRRESGQEQQYVPKTSIFGRMLNGDWSSKGAGSAPSPGGAPAEAAPHGSLPAPYQRYLDRLERLKHPSSFTTGANDNANPLLHNASFGGGSTGGSSSEGRAQAIIKGGVYEALIEFYGFLQGGAKGGAGGVQNASFTTGSVPGVSGGNIGDSFVKGGGSVSYGGGGAGGRRGGGGGDGGPGSDGSTSPPSGNLAAQRTGFQKELESDPQLKAYAIDAMQHEGGIQSNMEQLFNYAAMRKMTIRQALHSGQYGPVNRGLISGNISAKTRQTGEAALKSVYGGSNITDYATDQGMAGDPNFAKYMANREHFGMHKVQGAWFSAHGEQGVKWAQRQREADAKSAEDTKKSVAASAAVPAAATAAPGVGGDGGPGPVSERYSTRALNGEGFDMTGGGQGGSDAQGGGKPKRIYIRPGDSSSLDRSMLDKQNSASINSTGKLDVNVSAPPGTKVAYAGDNLLKNTSMQRQTQMMPTSGGPDTGDNSPSYMRGAA